MADLNDLVRIKAKADELRRDADRASGALSQVMARLKKEFKCGTLKEAKALLARMKAEEAEAKKAFDDAMAAFELEYGERLS